MLSRSRPCSRWPWGPALVLMLLFLVPAAATTGDAGGGAIAAGERRTHVLELPADHYVDIAVGQVGIDLHAALLDPNGAELAESDHRRGTSGAEYLTAITTSRGAYQVVMTARDGASEGRFTIVVETLRPASRSDHLFVAAERDYLAGIAAGREGTAEGHRRAVRHYRQAAATFRQADDAGGEAKARHNLGVSHQRLGEHAAARPALERAITLWPATGNKARESDSHASLGASLRHLGERQAARHHYDAARELAIAAGDNRRLARVWHNLGLLFKDLAQPDAAIDAYQSALALRIAAKDQAGEASTRTNLGALFDSLGDYHRAAEQLDQAVQLLEATGDQRRLMGALNNLGKVDDSRGEFAHARTYFDRAIKVAQDRGDRTAEARSLNNVGWSLHFEGDSARAVVVFERALSLLGDGADRAAMGTLWTNLARARSALGDRDAAHDAFRRALALRRELGDARGEGRTMADLAEALRLGGELGRAREAAERARLLATRATDTRTIAMSGLVLGRIESAQGRLEMGHRRIDDAVRQIESLRDRAPSAAWRSTFLASKHAYYEALIAIELDLDAAQPGIGWAGRAFETSERARAVALVDTLRAAAIEPHGDRDAEAARRERRLRQRVRLLAAERESGNLDPMGVTELERALAEHALASAHLAASDPRFAALTPARSASVHDVQALLDPGTALIEIALGDERSFLWWIDSQGLATATLPPRAEIAAAGRLLWNALRAREDIVHGESLAARRKRIAAADREAESVARTLGATLLGSVAKRLASQRLAFVVDGALAYLPFAVLVGPHSGRPLIEDHELVMVPSASALKVLRHDRPKIPRELHPITVVADPAYRPDSARPRIAASSNAIEGLRSSGGSMRPLPFAEAEARAIVALVGEGARLILGANASRENVLAGALAGARIVHIASHGIVDSEHPELSALVLSTVDAAGDPVDGRLRLQDIYRLRLDADLVVLSACQTALGPVLRGEGLLGLARGFMHAGAARVIASLWRVRDDTTMTLMTDLHRRLQAGERASQALRGAQLAVRAEHPAPFFWAGFVLEGDWR